MATPSYSARFSSATNRASPASSFVSMKLVAWNPSERSFSWTEAAISGCLPNPRMRQLVGREMEEVDILKLDHGVSSLARRQSQEHPPHEFPCSPRKSELFARGLNFNPILYTAASSLDRPE